MKIVLTALVVLAAVAALLIRPPQLSVPPAAVDGGSMRPLAAGDAVERSGRAPARLREAGHTAALAPVVYVAGSVRHPGVYALRPGSRAVDALARAGGALPGADLVAVNLAAPVADGDEIAVPAIGDRRAIAPRKGRSGPHPRSSHRRRAAGTRAPDTTGAPLEIDINHADEAELEAVPGIGPALAARIVAYRDENGPFTSIDEVADVDGISSRVEDALARAAVIR